MAASLYGYSMGSDGWHVFGFPQLDGLLFYTKQALLNAPPPGHVLLPAFPQEHWTQGMHVVHAWILNFGLDRYAALLDMLIKELVEHTLGQPNSGLSSWRPPPPLPTTQFGLRAPQSRDLPFTTILPGLAIPVGQADLLNARMPRRLPWLLPSPGPVVPAGKQVSGTVRASQIVAGPRYVQVRTYRQRKGKEEYTPNGYTCLSQGAVALLDIYKREMNAGTALCMPSFDGQIATNVRLYNFKMFQLGEPLSDLQLPAASLPRSVTWSCHLSWGETAEQQHHHSDHAFALHSFGTALHFTFDWPPYAIPSAASPINPVFQPVARNLSLHNDLPQQLSGAGEMYGMHSGFW
ncbi:hypothetical protein JCM10908_004486 [Rhodotorula pacifica]|uniref:uncharacterized protein n=1 Tax=Rhodotorula pacifica TaxID=1495444 RepID=UPI00316D4A86